MYNFTSFLKLISFASDKISVYYVKCYMFISNFLFNYLTIKGILFWVQKVCLAQEANRILEPETEFDELHIKV